jgi:hypothetical protein
MQCNNSLGIGDGATKASQCSLSLKNRLKRTACARSLVCLNTIRVRSGRTKRNKVTAFLVHAGEVHISNQGEIEQQA